MLSLLLSRHPCGTWNQSNGSWLKVSSDDSEGLDLTSLRWVAYAVFMPIIIAGGLLGNILNLVVLTRPALRGVTYVYLSGLAITDLGVMCCVIAMAIRFNNLQGRSYEAAFFHAHAELVATNSFMAASIFIVVCLTVDRYISVCLPTKFRSVHTRRNAKLAIAGSYMIAVTVSIPLMALKTVCVDVENHTLSTITMDELQHFSNTSHVYNFQENLLVTKSYFWRAYLWTSEITVRFGPALILAALNTLIIRKFRRLTDKRKRFRAASDKFRARHLLDSSSTSASTVNTPQAVIRGRNYHEERRLVVLLTAIIHLFFLTMTPSAFLSILYSENRDKDIGFQTFRAAANNLEIGNFALNFYVYFLCSKEFRRVFLLVFSTRSCCAKEVKPVPKGLPIRDHPDAEAVGMEDFSRNGTTVRPSPTRSPIHNPIVKEESKEAVVEKYVLHVD